MSLKVLILIPRLNLSGPARGACALFNGLVAAGVETELIPLDKGTEYQEKFANLLLIEQSNIFAKIYKFRKYFAENCLLSHKTIVISFCLQADILAIFSGVRDHSICSVRGNLYRNYAVDFGLKGYLIAWLHYRLISKFSVVTALNVAMQQKLCEFSRHVELIPNFLDEKSLQCVEKEPENTPRSCPLNRSRTRTCVLDVKPTSLKSNPTVIGGAGAGAGANPKR